MKIYRYQLQMTAPFHVDSKGNNSYTQSNDIIHSDTLSSALAVCWAQLEGQFPYQLTSDGQCSLPFMISSAMPYIGNQYFLPKPMMLNHLSLAQSDDPQWQTKHEWAKQLKKVRWISQDLWRIMMQLPDYQKTDKTSELVAYLNYLLSQGHHLKATFFASQPLPDGPIMTEKQVTRLATDRATNQAADGQLFDFASMCYHSSTGLYILATFDDESAQASFEAALNLLGDHGIGADRSTGHGQFVVQDRQMVTELCYQPAETMAMSLSTAVPGWQDTHVHNDAFYSSEKTAYELMSRGGWISGTGQRKKRFWAFSEGSTFAESFSGKIMDVSPSNVSHPVYRDCRAFCVAPEQESSS